MEIIVSARNFQLTEAIKSAVEDSLTGMRVSYPKLTKAEVVLSVTPGNRSKVEVVLHGNKVHLDAHAETEDMYKSIAQAVERLDRQLEKRLEKHHHNHKAQHLGEVEAELESEALYGNE